MPSENNHIDNFFRNKTAEASVDYSRVESDWQQMQLILPKPEIIPVKKATINSRVMRYMSYAAGAALIITSVILVKNKTTGKPVRSGTPIVNIKPKTNPLISKTSPNTPKVANKTTLAITKAKSQELTRENSKKTEVYAPVLITQSNPPDQQPLTIKPDSKTVFADFYDELKKPAQEFSINTQRDTTIKCIEGTTIFIPAGSFTTSSGTAVTGVVTINVQEFYNIADIMSNKLSTTSAGMPIETGGMLNIIATVNNEPVGIRPGVSLDLIMPASDFKPDMQLFIAGPSPTALPGNSTNSPVLNWNPAGQQQYFNARKMVRVINFLDWPYSVRKSGSRTVAKYVLAANCKLSVEEVKAEMTSRYGELYDVIKVKKSKHWFPYKKYKGSARSSMKEYDIYDGGIGDTITTDLCTAISYRLISSADSARLEEGFKKQLDAAIKERRAYAEYLKINDKYSFKIKELGWINCDRFLGYPRSRLTDIAVDPGAGFEGMYFQALMIFENEKAIMPGYWNNGKVVFPNLPVGHVVHIICTGAKDGKMYASVQKMVIKPSLSPELQFEVTSPREFRNKLTQFGSVK